MPKVLVIDDEPQIRQLIGRCLISHGIDVHTATSLAGVRTLLAEQRFDAAILDLMLGPLDGLDVLPEIRRAQPGCPVLVLSALGDVRTKVRSLDLGASDYLHKPFALAELVARVRRLLRESARPAGPQPERRTGDRRRAERRRELRGAQVSMQTVAQARVTVDRFRRVAYVGGRAVHLTPRECGLLHYLVEHTGEVCKREDLLAHVWGADAEHAPNVLEVYIARLRTKLSDQVIETVRRVGYQLVAA